MSGRQSSVVVIWGREGHRTTQQAAFTVCAAHPPVAAIASWVTLWDGSRSSVYGACNEPSAVVRVVKSWKANPGCADVHLQAASGVGKIVAWTSDTYPGSLSQVLENLRGLNLWGFSFCGLAIPLPPSYLSCRGVLTNHRQLVPSPRLMVGRNDSNAYPRFRWL